MAGGMGEQGEFTHEPPKVDGFATSSPAGSSTMSNISDMWTRLDRIFIPIGMVATAFGLAYGLRGMMSGGVRQQNVGMRMRVGFQGLTLLGLLAVVFYGGGKQFQSTQQGTKEFIAQSEKASVRCEKK